MRAAPASAHAAACRSTQCGQVRRRRCTRGPPQETPLPARPPHLGKREEQGHIAVDALALQQLAGTDAFPGASDLQGVAVVVREAHGGGCWYDGKGLRYSSAGPPSMQPLHALSPAHHTTTASRTTPHYRTAQPRTLMYRRPGSTPRATYRSSRCSALS